MKIINQYIFEGRNIYSHRKCIKLDVDLEGYSETPTKNIENFNNILTKLIPELYTHRCGIDEPLGFIKRLNEGTYLAHVCEHIIIAIHNKLGINIKYGKAREIKNEFYYIIYEYEFKNTGIAIGQFAVEIVNSLIKNKKFNYEEKIKLILNILNDEYIGTSTNAICEAAKEENLPIIPMCNGEIYQIAYGKRGRRFNATIGHNTNGLGIDISCDKLLTKEILNLQCIPVAKGEKIYNTIQLLETANNIGYPVVIKPQYGNKGKNVFLNIENEKILLKSYKVLLENTKDIIMEKFIKGNDFRVCVVNYKVIAVSKRTPPFVLGNGIKSIKELINELNNNPLRGNDHEKPLTKVNIDNELIQCLENQKLTLEYIPKTNETINLRYNANLSTGGFSQDLTDEICKENIEICERAAKALNLDICGLDICTETINEPLYNNGVIVEINSAPGIRMHHHPNIGKPRNVAKAILDTMYNGEYSNIPVISITGTNGKTTTVRLINYILRLIGYVTGMTSTDGIYIGEKCIHKGDDTGIESARAVLTNPDVEVAVLETARGGMIKRGIGYDLADVGVITNITEDHLGCDNINNLQDLAHVKSLVVEAVKDDGYAVINGDDEYSVKILDRIKSKIIVFSLNKDNKVLNENLNKGNPCVYLDNDKIYVANNGKKYFICAINEMPITLNGKLKYNIYNALAACSALIGIGVDYCIISKGFKEFKLDEKFNIGRFNKFEVNGVDVILDYGHNIEGYKAIIESLKYMDYRKVFGIIGVPGDRRDESIFKIGEISGEFFNHIIIKEDKDKRNRKDGEVAKLLYNGVLKTYKNNNIDIILNEYEALEFAIEKAKKGDAIIIFFEKYNHLYELIMKKKALINNSLRLVE
ncbi:cyanophycin synthetase [Clostridium tarantellae]|uniref:Cyanophycin synthetase n=1 Tax=Clostridium tarantellae TaxID=39493 RepID=A0A6I1MQ61_9CLOT|nr:cyanophycin synthetase [Clostridium tarantellae]MPQ43011.1 cyanophycin synthetase [Clostridium tarantellae]